MSLPFRPDLESLRAPDTETSKDNGAHVWIIFVLCAIGGMAGGLFAEGCVSDPIHIPDGQLNGVTLFLTGLSLIVCAALALPVHEAGHVLGGWMQGYRFLLYIVGPLMIVRTSRGVDLRWNHDLSLYGGLSASVPPDGSDLARRNVWMVAAGPVLSLVAGAVAVACAWVLGDHVLAPGVGLFGVASVLIGLVTLIPGTTSGFPTDGARLLGFVRGTALTVRDASVTALTGALFRTRPRDWDAELVADAIRKADGTVNDVEARRLAYLHALDQGKPVIARDHLQAALDHFMRYPASSRSELFAEAAFFEGAVRSDGDAARRWIGRMKDGRSSAAFSGAQARAKLAEAYAQGSVCGEQVRRARESVVAHAASGLGMAERDWVDALENRGASSAGSGKVRPEGN